MIDTQDLCYAVREASKQVKSASRKEEQYTQAVYELFESAAPRFEPLFEGGRFVDVRLRARWRLSQYLDRYEGTMWRQWTVQRLISWLIENWETVIKILLTLIMVII